MPGVIYFSTGKVFFKILAKDSSSICKRATVIVDEFDSLLLHLDSETAFKTFLVSQIKSVFAFTGSDLQPFHIQFIQNALRGHYLDLNKRDIERKEAEMLSCQVHSKLADYRKDIIESASAQVINTPVVIILSEGADKIVSGFSKKRVPVVNLIDKGSDHVDSALTLFADRQEAGYSVFIIGAP
jgi:hypothetical protein